VKNSFNLRLFSVMAPKSKSDDMNVAATDTNEK